MWKKTKKERRKREAIQFVSVLAEEEEEEKGRQCQRERERERERETYFLLTGYVLEGSCILFQMFFFPPPLQCKYEVFPFLCTLTRLFLFFFFTITTVLPPLPPTQLLPIILKLVKTLNNK